MNMSGPLLLPGDVHLIAAGNLAPDLRARLELDDDQFALTRPHTRSMSKVLDADAARLVELFREPSTVVDAVVRFAEAEDRDPRDVLREAFPLLRRLVRANVLVAPDSEDAAAIGPSLAPGELFAGFTVVRAVQTLEDTEVFQVRSREGDAAALKVARRDDRRLRRAYEREAAILRHLDGVAAPRVLAAADADADAEARPHVVTEWREGVNPLTAAAEARRRGDRQAVLAIALALATAYAALHERGVLHGDVHPGNAMIGRDGAVTLVDFGLARWPGLERRLATADRGGVAWYADPEFARARLAGERPPEVDAASEQYALAALLYTILTGERYLDFALEKEVLYRQVVEDEPRPFVRSGAEPWPAVEAVLARALSKEPGARFPTVRELAGGLGAAAGAAPRSAAGARHTAPAGARTVLDRVLARVSPAGELWPPTEWEGPTASVNYGAAGIGYALYRMALLREDPATLADADLWVARARSDAAAGERPFYDSGFGVPREVATGVSPYHAEAGLACVEALVAQAMGDITSHARAVNAFVEAARRPSRHLDLTLGRAGALLGAALLLESRGWDEERTREPLTALAAEALPELWSRLDSYPALTRAELSYLGIAHGWGGVLYATLRACRAAGLQLPAGFRGRLDELAELGEPYLRGLRWRRKLDDPAGDYVPSWCNGSAGLVSLWLLAHRELGDSRYLSLAEGAGWNAWEDRDPMANLCCGHAGRAYSQLALYRHTGEDEWLGRARDLAQRAAEGSAAPAGMSRASLYKGDLAVALLAVDLERPERSCFPMFEDEGFAAGG